MEQKLVHQWRDWLLKYVGNGEYELIEKNNLSVHMLSAKDHIEAESRCQLIIKSAQQKQPSELAAGVQT